MPYKVEANMRHAILGAGGVGGLIAAALAKSGDSVTVVLRPEALDEYPAELSLESPFGSFRVPVERARDVTQLFDVLWIAVKATHLEAALRGVANAEQLGAIVPLLNGLDHVALLRSRFGHERVVPATIAVESERAAPGTIIHRSPSARLNVSSIGESRLASTIEKLRQFGFNCQFSTNELRMLCNKLAILAPCALTTTASGLTMGEVAADPVWRKRMEAGVYEACAVATGTEPRWTLPTSFDSSAAFRQGRAARCRKTSLREILPNWTALPGRSYASLRNTDSMCRSHGNWSR